MTSEKFFGDSFPDKPFKSLTILGGGVIAAEFAHFFSSLGTKVTIVQRNPRLLPNFDDDIVVQLLEEYENKNIDVYLDSNMIEVKQINNQVEMIIENDSTGEKTNIVSEQLFVAIGLVTNSATLQVEKLV